MAVLGALAVVGFGCTTVGGAGDTVGPLDASKLAVPTSSSLPPPSLPDPDGGTSARGAASRWASLATLRGDELVGVVVGDLEDFWGDESLRQYGRSYESPEPALAVNLSAGQPPPDCGGKPLTVERLANNALYCPGDDRVVWDAALFGDLADTVGPFGVALVLAHEWGHVIQARTGWPATVVAVELQADCFAGAWTARVQAGGSRSLRLQPGDLDAALAGFLRFRDGVGAGEAHRHGSAFDRIAAFSDGLAGGVGRCATYRSTPPALVPLAVSPQDLAGANVPLDQLLALLPFQLERFWEEQVVGDGSPIAADFRPVTEAAAGSCPPPSGERPAPSAWTCPGGHIRWNVDGLAALHAALGDYAVALVLARQWGSVVAEKLGGSLAGGSTVADCLAGVWAAASVTVDPAVRQVRTQLTAGDLDEAVAGILADRPAPQAAGPTAFDRLAAFRAGFSGNFLACRPPGA